MESQNFLRIIPMKRLPFRRIIHGKSNSTNYPAESFSIPRKVKFSLFKGLSLLLKLIFDKNSTMDDQYYPRFGRKNVKICDNLGNFFYFPRIIRGKSNFVHEYLREFAKKYMTISCVHQGPIRC